MSKKYDVEVEGSFEAFIDFTEVYTFVLEEGYILTFPTNEGKGIRKEFKLYREDSPEFIKQDEIYQVMERFLSWLTFAVNVSCHTLTIGDVSVRGEGEAFSSSERALVTTGVLPFKEVHMERLKEIMKIKPEPYVFELYRKSLSEDIYTSFWHVYTIMLILVYNSKKLESERKQIDEELNVYAPEMQRLSNDYDGKEWCLFIAIRDSFNHEVTFSGEELNIQEQLEKNMDEFREIIRRIISDKLTISS
jgi:hypothetical protein